MAPLPEAPPDEPAAAFAGLRDTRTAGHRRRRRRRAPTSPSRSSTATPASWSPTATATTIAIASVVKLFIADDLLLQVSKGQTAALPRGPRRRSTSCCGPPTTAPPRSFWNRSGGSAIINRVVGPLRAGFDAPAEQRAVVQHHQHGDRPGALLRHDAGGHRRTAARAGQHHPVQPGAVDADGAGRHGARRRLPAAVRHPRGAVRRARCGQAGLDVLHRLRLDAPVDRRDRARTGATSWRSARCRPPTPTTRAQTITQAVKTMFPGGRI